MSGRLHFPGWPGSAMGRGGQGVGARVLPPPHAVDHPWDTAKARPRWNRGFLARTVEAGALRRGAELDAAQAELWPVTHQSMADKRGKSGNSDILFSWASKSLQMVTAAMKLKDACSLEGKVCQTFRQHIKKQRHHVADKGLSSQSYAFSSSHVWM